MKVFKKTLIIMISLMFFLLSMGVGPLQSKKTGEEEHEEIQQKVFETFKDHLPQSHTRYARSIASTIMRESVKYKIDPMMITAVIAGESSFNPNTIGPIGEIGLMQLRPSTAEWIANKMQIEWRGKKMLKNPMYNIRLGVAYLGYLKSRYSPKDGLLYLAAYNMGETSLLRLLSQNKMPNIYSTHIMKNYLAINE